MQTVLLDRHMQDAVTWCISDLYLCMILPLQGLLCVHNTLSSTQCRNGGCSVTVGLEACAFCHLPCHLNVANGSCLHFHISSIDVVFLFMLLVRACWLANLTIASRGILELYTLYLFVTNLASPASFSSSFCAVILCRPPTMNSICRRMVAAARILSIVARKLIKFVYPIKFNHMLYYLYQL